MAVTIDEEKARELREKGARQTWYDVDPRLSVFLDLLFGENDENPEGNASLTLVTHGATISGRVVSAAKYEEEQAASVDEASPVMAKALRSMIPTWESIRADRQREGDAFTALRRYAHFVDASVISGSVRLELHNLRVDLKDVSAWTIGAVS